MKRMSQTLAAVLHPERYPAPLGRGPDDWPLVGCAVCRRAIPWPTHPRTHISLPPAYYYRRRFCSRECDKDGAKMKGTVKVALEGRNHVARLVLQWKDRWQVPLPTEPAFAAGFPFFDEIRQCRQCRGTTLTELSIGKRCFSCGTIMYARDGDWQREARVGSVAK